MHRSVKSGALIAQQNPDEPVIKKGHCKEKNDSELDKKDDMDLLQV